MQRQICRASRCFLVTAVACGFLAAATPVSEAGEFPDGWYFYKEKRPQEYRDMEGKRARRLKLAEWIGEEQNLSNLIGKVVVVDFWATWCGPCRKALPHNVEMMNKYGDQGLVIIGVHDSKRGKERMAKMAEDFKLNYPLAVDDGQFSERSYRIKFWPSYFVIDRKGHVRAAGLEPGRVDDVVEKLLAEPPPKEGELPRKRHGESRGQTPPPVAGTNAGPGEIPAGWLEGSARDRRRYAGLLAEGTPPAIASTEWINSEPLALGALRGKVVMLDFWGTWCAPCIGSIPKINELHRKYQDQGLVIIGVCDHRNVEKMASVAEDKKIEYAICGDHGGNMTRAYQVNSFPDYFFIDRSGRLRAADVRNDKIEDVIKLLLAEPDPTVAAGH